MLPRSETLLEFCLVRLRPRLLASSESLALNECVEDAHLEFLRITEVTASVSDSNTCFRDTDDGEDATLDELAAESMMIQACRSK